MEIDNVFIKRALQKLGFSHLIDYVNNDATKSKYEDAYNFICELLQVTRMNKLSEFATKFKKNLDVNLELLKEMEPNKYVMDTYDDIKRGNANKDVLVDILIYHIIEDNRTK